MNRSNSEDGFAFSVREMATMLMRRRGWLILSAILGLLAGFAAFQLQKPQYKSAATLLIESAQIPSSLVAAPLMNMANERIAKIRQQIISNDSLARLIEQNELYAKHRTSVPMAELMDAMRSDIGVDLVGANQGNNGGSTIAFTLSFIYDEPAKAQAVTSRLTRMFLAEDKRLRTEQATGTATFLQRRAEELRLQLATFEDKRRRVEARYAGALPGNVAISAQSGAGLRAEISRTDAETQGLVQQNSLLAARAGEAGQMSQPRTEALRRAEDRLTQLTSTYSDGHPDVVVARAVVKRQRSALEADPPPDPSNLLRSELSAAHARIGTLSARRSELVREMAELDHRTAQAPQAAYELNMIEREYDNIKRQYESLREKQLDAQVTANLQSEDKGERFSIVDEPSFPNTPLGQSRATLLLTGLLAGAVAGAFLIVLFELALGTIHGETSLAAIMGARTLGIVPRQDCGNLRASIWPRLADHARRLIALFGTRKRHAS